jgi:putative tricarboxylic transport membrane protein
MRALSILATLFEPGCLVALHPVLRATTLSGIMKTAIALSTAFALAIPCTTGAQSWKPSRHVEIVAPSAAGGGSDIVARLVHRILQENKIVDAPLNVVNKAGAGGTLAWSSLNQFAGDGHHIAISTANLLTNYIAGTSTLNYTDLTPVAQLFSEYAGIAVRTDSALKSGRELIEQLKRDPAKLSAAIGTTLGSVGHIALALTTKAGGNDAKKLKAVVFPGAGNALTALLGGHVDIMASPVSNLVPHAADGKLRIIAVAAPKRLGGALAQTPTLAEQGANVAVDSLRGVVGPKGMTQAQIAYWEGALRKMVDTSAWRDNLERNLWENSFTGAEGSAKALKVQYEEMRTGMAELGLAKN